MKSQPTFMVLWFRIPFKGNEMAISSKRRSPDNLESHSSIKPIFTNVWGFRSNLVECESFIESNSPEIPDLCERNLTQMTQMIAVFSLQGVIFF